MTNIRHIVIVPCLISLLMTLGGIFGCTRIPTAYTIPQTELETMRDEIFSVAVVGGHYRSMERLDLPAKGILAAGGRGFVSGAGATIAAGAVSPVPGGTVIGMALSPIGGVIGFFRGMIVAEPADKVNAAETTLTMAVESLRSMRLSDTFRTDLLDIASKRAGKQFRYYTNHGPLTPEDNPTYAPTDFPGADTVLEVRPLRAGLWGLWTVNPPASPFVEVGIRLIRLRDGAVLINDTFRCAGEERSYEEWAENSELFVDEIVKCIPKLVNKIVDDTFLVNALSRRR